MSARLLLVDDDESARFTLLALLEDAGFEVVDVSSSHEARARIRERGFELVLLDEHIGDELGSALVPEIRASAPDARVIIVSGSAQSAASHADAFFEKGGAFVDLLSVIARLLPSRR